MKKRTLLAALAAYLTLGVDPDPAAGGDAGGAPPDAGADAGGAPAGGGADPGQGDDLADLDLDSGDAGGDAGAGGAPDNAAMVARAERAEREAREAREELARARAPAQHSAPPDPSRAQWDEEERQLRDPATPEMTKWTINTNRTLRQQQAAANMALRNSRDLADRANFDRVMAEKPLAKKYSPRVEEKLAEIRKMGGDPDRMFVLKMLVGDDIVEGRVKTKARAAAAPANPAQQQADRGKTLPGRGDVRGKGAASEREKRIARLEGQRI